MRSLTADFLARISANVVNIGAICEIDYPGATLRAWTGIGDLSWAGHTWKGVGDLGGISAIQERSGAQAGNVTLSIPAVAAGMRAIALADSSAGCAVKIWIACFDIDAGTGAWSVVSDPWLPFEGTTDTHKITASMIELAVETYLARLRQAKIARYTDQEQKRFYPSDLGFEFAAVVDQSPIYWGVATPAGSVGTGGGGGGGDVGSHLE